MESRCTIWLEIIKNHAHRPEQNTHLPLLRFCTRPPLYRLLGILYPGHRIAIYWTLRFPDICLSHTFTHFSLNRTDPTKLCSIWISLFLYSVLSVNSPTCTIYTMSTKFSKLVNVSTENVGMNLANILGKSGKFSFQNKQSADVCNIPWKAPLSIVLINLVSIEFSSTTLSAF